MVVTLIRNKLWAKSDAVYCNDSLTLVLEESPLDVFHNYQTLARSLGAEVFVVSCKLSNPEFAESLKEELSKPQYHDDSDQYMKPVCIELKTGKEITIDKLLFETDTTARCKAFLDKSLERLKIATEHAKNARDRYFKHFGHYGD